MKRHQVQHAFFFSLLIGMLLLVTWLLLPYLSTIALAGALAILVYPIHERLTLGLKGRASLSATIVTLMVIAAVAVPISFIGFQIFHEARELYSEVSNHQSIYLGTVNTAIATYIQPYLPQVSLDAEQLFKQGASWLIGHFDDIFTGTLTTVIHVLLTLVALFYFLRDGKRFTTELMHYSPLPDRHDRDILQKLYIAVHSVFRGSLLIALIQGCMTGIGLALFGVPNPSLWGSITAVCALIPGLGTSLILIPAILYLFAIGHTADGVGMLVWGALAVGLIDNVLGPSLISKGMQAHPLLILFSVIGGISLFGPLGFIFGPLSISFLLALLEIYRLILSRKGEKLPF